MIHMLVRNRVADFDRWRAVFDAQLTRARSAGLRLVHLWQAIEDPNDVFFLLEVESREQAMAFLNAPASAKAGEASGVLDGEWHLVEDAMDR